MELIIFTVIYISAFFAASYGLYFLSGILIMGAAVYLGVYYYMACRSLTNPAMLFSLSWAGGVGVSALKLSALQTDWTPTAWLCFYLALICFIIAYKLVSGRLRRVTKHHPASGSKGYAGDIRFCMNAVLCVSVAAFILEAAVLGYVPLFTVDTPHAYSYFHISGVHYFTVSCVLLPAMCIMFLAAKSDDAVRTGSAAAADSAADEGRTASVIVARAEQTAPAAVTGADRSQASNQGTGYADDNNSGLPGKGLHRSGYLRLLSRFGLTPAEAVNVIVCGAAGIIIPVLLVSRYQMIFAAALACVTFVLFASVKLKRRINVKDIAAAALIGAAGLLLYVFITIERAHSVEYLNGIFEMKYSGIPIFITQPYIYIANNFDNFNCLVVGLTEHTHGLRMLFPAIALTGLKFIRPELASFPIYVTKEELTTVTLIYDAFYDFGIPGVMLFAAAIGAVGAWLENRSVYYIKYRSCAFAFIPIMIYAQYCMYLMLSFFTTWYSNPTTFFLFGVTVLCGLYCIFRLFKRIS